MCDKAGKVFSSDLSSSFKRSVLSVICVINPTVAVQPWKGSSWGTRAQSLINLPKVLWPVSGGAGFENSFLDITAHVPGFFSSYSENGNRINPWGLGWAMLAPLPSSPASPHLHNFQMTFRGSFEGKEEWLRCLLLKCNMESKSHLFQEAHPDRFR